MKLALSSLFAFVAVVLLPSASAEPEIFDEEQILPSSAYMKAEPQDTTPTSATDDDSWWDEVVRRHIIPDQFVVVFHGERVTNATVTGLRLVSDYGDEEAELLWSYHVAFRGVTIGGVSDSMREALTKDPDVDYFEPVSVLDVCIHFIG